MKMFTRFHPHPIHWIAYLLASASLILQLYFYFPLNVRTSLSWLIFGATILLIISVLLWLETEYFIIPLWKGISLRKKITWIALSGCTTALLFSSIAPNIVQISEKFADLAPEEVFEIRPFYLSSNATLDIWKIKAGNTRIPVENIFLEGTWHKEENHLWTDDPQAVLILHGKIPFTVTVSFWRSPNAGQVAVHWDGMSKKINLYGEKIEEALFTFQYNPYNKPEPAPAKWIRLATVPAWASLALFVCGVFFDPSGLQRKR
jgi:hypothetical protein